MKKMKMKSTDVIGWIFNAPYLVYTVIFFLIPLCWAVWLSTTDWNLISEAKNFVGLNNFIQAFSDEKIQKAFTNSFKYLAYLVTLTVSFSIIVGLIVSQLPDKIKGVVAVLFFIPYLTSGVATAVVVRYLFSYNSVLNTFLRDRFDLNINWFTDASYAFAIVIGIIVWKMAGYYGLFILSAIEAIPEEVHEAGMLDGSVGIHKFVHITFPMIMPTLTSVVVLSAGLAFGLFTEPYLLTGGGPSLATTAWQLEIYNISFVKFQSGYGASVAILNAINIFVVIKIISLFMNKLNKRFGWT